VAEAKTESTSSGGVGGRRAVSSATDSKQIHVPAEQAAADESVSLLLDQCRKGRLNDVARLLAAGTNPDATDTGSGNTALISACQIGHMPIVRLLVAEYAANVNCANLQGNTALHYCFNGGFDEISHFLIGNGADEYAINNAGLTCYEGLTRSDVDDL
jgi:ankyrin repeat protein